MSPSRKAAPSSMVGLDIGSDTIKVAEAKYGKDGITITGLGIARTPEGAIENEVIVDPQALGHAIKALLAESGIKTKKCVSSVAGQSQVVVRVIEVPKMNPKELAESMQWEIERHVPFSPTEVVKDFQALENPSADPNAQSMEVFLAVAQSQFIDKHVQTLFAAGLKPTAIDIEPLATSRVLVDLSPNGAAEEIVAVVNIGNNNADLSIYENGVPVCPSLILGIPGSSFTREISEALGQTLEQAEITKKEYAVVDLNGFGDPYAADDQAQANNGQPASEPTSFDMSVGPSSQFASVFDGDAPVAAPAPEPAADSLAAEPAQLSDFTSTIDGPVFNTEDPMIGPAFDFGGGSAAAPTGPSFDLGGEAQSAPAGPSFDLGGDSSMFGTPTPDLAGNEPQAAPAGPMFDLDDEENDSSPKEEQMAPSFDLSDTDDAADPGDQVAYAEPTFKAPAPSAPLVDGSTEAQVFQAISGVLIDLANEIRRSLDYYINKYGQAPTRLFLCGGTAKMPRLDDFLSRELGIPVYIADPLSNVNVKVTGSSEQYMKEISPLMCVSIGLAVRDMIG